VLLTSLLVTNTFEMELVSESEVGLAKARSQTNTRVAAIGHHANLKKEHLL